MSQLEILNAWKRPRRIRLRRNPIVVVGYSDRDQCYVRAHLGGETTILR